MIKQKFDLKDFLPSEIISGIKENKYPLQVRDSGDYLCLSYSRPVCNWKGLTGQGKREYSDLINRYIQRNQETFEVLGLLQAEMGKTQNGCLTFCNHENHIIKKVITWFEKELEIIHKDWKWYIKVNINEPLNQDYKEEIENKVINYWIKKTGLSLEQSYPKKVTYVKNTKNKKLKFYDYGTLIIERKMNLFSQVVKNLVRKITQNILNYEEDEIRNFMKGIIAGESNVEINLKSKHYRVFVSAEDFEERKFYQNCFNKLGINSTVYSNFHGVVISKKENILELLKQRLMTLSPKKYNKFLRMIKLYKDFEGLERWRNKLKKPRNKISQDKIDKILELHKLYPNWPAWKIAEQTGISAIKVQRVRKECGLGKRLVKTLESKRKEIAMFVEGNPKLTQKQIADIFNVHESVIRRAIEKYSTKKTNKFIYGIGKEEIKKVIKI